LLKLIKKGFLGLSNMTVTTRLAVIDDLPAIISMLADDVLGREREDARHPLPESYYKAFAAIDADPNNEILVAIQDGKVVATLQITYTPSLSYRGSWRATLESVRTAAALRGQGIGTALVREAMRRAGQRGCGSVQLSTNKTRTDARRFYEQLGFTASHEGMKLAL
jgi:ribosomal protein S18 acetylase RimI-like enzyme